MSNPLDQFESGGAETPSFRVPAEMPVLPLRDTVLFPQAFMPLAVARESSVKLIDEAVASGQTIAVFAQREAGEDEPTQKGRARWRGWRSGPGCKRAARS